MIVVIVIALIILGYFGFNIKDIIESEKVQNNLHYVWDFTVKIWNLYLAAPVVFVWNKFVVGVLWKYILLGLGSM
ncbi:MAG: hypothetical protein NTU76_02745 [Candidatus Taylorbacteria bacterium]|nr:hypothetical protein [Candidatus Taylorbacteria bacterium]